MQINTKSILTFIIAAGIVLAIWFLTRSTVNSAAMADTYLLPYPNLIAPLQQQNSGDTSNYTEAFRMYELGYHGKAEDLFMSLDRNDEAVQFYRAINAMFNHELEIARKGLADIVKNSDHRFYEPAKWYLALEELRNGDRRQGIKLLENLANGDSEFRAEASGLLDRIAVP